MFIWKALWLLSTIQLSLGDVYMHNPRGSSDRNCERNANRNNGNRLFDSENNNAGGYACPRAVGDGTFQSEMGIASFDAVDPITGDTTTFYQDKRMYYYSGSILPVEWTNQHGCGGNSKVSCEIILQYACEDTLDPKVDDFWPWVMNKAEAGTTYRGTQHFRDTAGDNIAAPRDGVPTDSLDSATDTITDTEASAIPNTADTRRFGMHESYDYYQLCQHTERNKGLYTADQKVRRNDRRGTRQNPNGNRHGFECPEERDYYPWWAPSPWVDIAVLSDSAGNSICYHDTPMCSKRCEYYMNNTMNYHPKGYCDVNHTDSRSTVQTKLTSSKWNNNMWYNNRGACHSAGFHWYEVSHADNLDFGSSEFVCAHTQFARVNQLGNARADSVVSQSQALNSGVVASNVVEGVNANRFMWTIPNVPTIKLSHAKNYSNDLPAMYKSCTLRLRYNISSADFQQWPVDAVDPGTSRMVDHHNNSRTTYDPNTPLHQDPYVYIGPGDHANKGSMFLSLAVNTNQYGRTFQDRSYAFSIKALPQASAAENTEMDTPAFDSAKVIAATVAGGKIYNVNVRGKRGNIVEVYPSVEYDFVPNALSLSTNDMIHFQWTGSDYNPRRGCNDGEGGPPDANTFSTDANADLNSRADRSNVVLTKHMANNVPMDYLGYDHTDYNLTFAQMTTLANSTVLQHAPCYNPATDNHVTAAQCYQTIMRLAYLNQQLDGGSLVLRAGKKCLTQYQLDTMTNQDTARNHPLNCAKLNAKPFPYFDGGIMFLRKMGWFPFFSSRNNNFSNRQQIGIICVGSQCKVSNSTGVLQDTNPAVSGTSVVRSAPSKCYSTANGEAGATGNGAVSCVPASTTAAATSTQAVLTAESFTVSNKDNDNLGDGNKHGCSIASNSMPSLVGTHTVEQRVALALILLFVGLFSSWLSYYLYNRWQASKLAEGKFRYDTAWQADMEGKGVTGKSYIPASTGQVARLTNNFRKPNALSTGGRGPSANRPVSTRTQSLTEPVSASAGAVSAAQSPTGASRPVLAKSNSLRQAASPTNVEMTSSAAPPAAPGTGTGGGAGGKTAAPRKNRNTSPRRQDMI